MARRTTFKLPGLRTWVDNIKNEVSKEASEQIVRDLQVVGPFWSGTFANSWVIRSGDVRISATTPPPSAILVAPKSRRYVKVEAPEPKGRKSVYLTIGNTTSYRDLAMDLDPGRRRWRGGEPPNTAPQDWYRSYVEGGNLRLTLQQATKRVAADPKVRGYKGREGQP